MKKIAILGLSYLMLVMSCRKEGCIDPLATNYNDKANEDDGSCVYDTTTPQGPQLKFTAVFDPTLPRLDNFGQPIAVGAGNAAISPDMKFASIHYIELAPTEFTALGDGEVIYMGAETTAGGSRAVDFSNAVVVDNGGEVASVDISGVTAGTYKYVRVSLTYQNYDIPYTTHEAPFTSGYDGIGRLASFVGYNNYIESFQIWDSTKTLNRDELQGYWAFETHVDYLGTTYGTVLEGTGAGVTVVNPINSTSPVPAGSCVVTGEFATPLVITDNEDGTRTVALKFSTNQSFEWQEVTVDGKYEPSVGETVVDMGLRGLHPVEQ